MRSLFDVRGLFSHPLKHAFHVDNTICYGGLSGFGSDRVDFSIEFLEEKVQFTADRLGIFEGLGKLRGVA